MQGRNIQQISIKQLASLIAGFLFKLNQQQRQQTVIMLFIELPVLIEPRHLGFIELSVHVLFNISS